MPRIYEYPAHHRLRFRCPGKGILAQTKNESFRISALKEGYWTTALELIQYGSAVFASKALCILLPSKAKMYPMGYPSLIYEPTGFLFSAIWDLIAPPFIFERSVSPIPKKRCHQFNIRVTNTYLRGDFSPLTNCCQNVGKDLVGSLPRQPVPFSG